MGLDAKPPQPEPEQRAEREVAMQSGHVLQPCIPAQLEIVLGAADGSVGLDLAAQAEHQLGRHCR